MTLLQKFKSWRISRAHRKYMKENPHQMYWGTVKMDENDEPFVDETCSFGPWTFEQIDITGNKEIKDL